MKIDIDGYFFFEDHSGDRYLMIAEEDYDIVFDYIREKGIKNIMLGQNTGCSGDNLDFLGDDYKFEKIELFFKDPVDISKLAYQNELKSLCLSDALLDIDYNIFPQLESLTLIGQKKEIKPFTKNNRLKYLKIYEFLNRDLSFLQNCHRLEQLILNNTRYLHSLSGIENSLNTLHQLQISYLQNLTSLWDPVPAPALKKLFIENCPNLKDLDVLQQAKNLELMSINKCRELNSLRFIDQLPLLQEVYLERTEVLDSYIPSLVKAFK